MYLYLDIETIPSPRNDVRDRMHSEALEAARSAEPPSNYKKEDAIAKWRAAQIEGAPGKADELWRRTALDGGYGEIVVIGYAPEHGALDEAVAHDGEREMLQRFWISMREMWGQKRVVPVGHCIGFDLRFLYQRSVIRGIRPTIHLPYNAAPWRGEYVDTMYEWCGAKGGVKLTVLCDMLQIDVPNEDVDGSQVWDAWSAGRVVDVVDHCRADVERVRRVHQRLRWEK